ncbi:RNA polymerase sigma factor [Robertkochia marina]|uniref:RNA polymerase sigma factor n=2 Tax=Robertkochia marina TaxID=1227945 RepID=A0A4S3M217_9FLAO|nr:RNA polymerase sigma factor [Robertkochia marina]TRZ44618.1 RNA polymerase sigma factor [Robertkochia marina]
MSQSSVNNQLLIDRCRKGDQQAQMQVYRTYYQAMYNISVRIVKDPYEAEDVMQESFLSAFTKIDNFKGEVTFGAWLKRIVINNSIQHYRKKQKEDEISFDKVSYRVEDHEEVVTDHEFTNMKAQKVLQTMKLLKDNYRVALTLHLIEGYDYEEICEIMDISYANCRTTISRAKERLRKHLIEMAYE